MEINERRNVLRKRATLVLAITLAGILLGLNYGYAGLVFEQRTTFTAEVTPATEQQYDMLKEQMQSVPPAARAQMEKALKELEGSFVPETTYQTMYFENGKMKIVDANTSDITIIRTDKDVMWHINTKDSTYTEVRLSEIKDMLGKATEALEKLSQEMTEIPEEEPHKEIWTEYKIEETNETKRIAGYNCQKVIVTTPSEELEIWITKEIDFEKYLTSFEDFYKDLGFKDELLKTMSKISGFPMITKSKDMTQEVLRVSVKKLSEKAFSLPTGLKMDKIGLLKDIDIEEE